MYREHAHVSRTQIKIMFQCLLLEKVFDRMVKAMLGKPIFHIRVLSFRLQPRWQVQLSAARTLGSIRWWFKYWVLATHVGNLIWITGSWPVPGQVPGYCRHLENELIVFVPHFSFDKTIRQTKNIYFLLKEVTSTSIGTNRGKIQFNSRIIFK